MVTVYEPNENSIYFKNCHHDHIPFNAKGNVNIVFTVCDAFSGAESNVGRNVVFLRCFFSGKNHKKL